MHQPGLSYSSTEEFLQYPVKLAVVGSGCKPLGVLNTKVIVFAEAG